jgi:hypothetical protein
MYYVFLTLFSLMALVITIATGPNFITRPIANFIGRLRGLPEHDPMDWRTTSSSGSWNTGTYCANCKSWTGHNDIMSRICGECGSSKGVRNYRSSRKIWNGRKWVVQHKYNDGANGFTVSS